jgi:hypothetical protein
MASRPAGSVTNPRYSYAQPSRRTSAYSGAWSTPGPQQQQQSRQDYGRDRDAYATPRESYVRDSDAPRDTPQAESSGSSSYEQYQSQQSSQQPQDGGGYYQPYPQDYSPPRTPTRSGNQQFTYPQQTNTGLPSPEPDVEYPRVPPKPPTHNFTTRPATPPSSDVSNDKKKGKMSKFKRFSGLLKSKA